MIHNFEFFLNENLLKGKTKDKVLYDINKSNFSDNHIILLSIKYQTFDIIKRDVDGRCIYDGNLDISDHKIKSLPENLTINGNLYCYDCELEQLPKGLVVENDLLCQNNNLTELPSDLNVGLNLKCGSNKLNKLPDNLTISGYLFCDDNNLTKLPKKLNVRGDFNCEKNNLTELPSDLNVGEYLRCGGQKSGIKLELPPTSKIQDMYFNNKLIDFSKLLNLKKINT